MKNKSIPVRRALRVNLFEARRLLWSGAKKAREYLERHYGSTLANKLMEQCVKRYANRSLELNPYRFATLKDQIKERLKLLRD